MKTSTFTKLLAWLILFIVLLNLAYYMISMPNTMLNIGGVILLAFTLFGTIKTKCLTNIKNKER